MQEDTSFRGDVIGLCISIKGRHTEGKGRHQRGLTLLKHYYSLFLKLVTKFLEAMCRGEVVTVEISFSLSLWELKWP